MDHVIVGNGVAGITAANRVRSRDGAANITVVSKESEHFFARTALMYVFCGQMSERDVEPLERDHYERMRFKRVRDRAAGIDTENRRLRMESGKDIAYDRLLIASGSVPRMLDCPGKDLNGVGNFVTWQNLKWMQKEAQTARKAVIVGGGLIGIEVAEILLHAGIEVSFLIRDGYFWPIALDTNEGTMVVDHMRHHGCDVRLMTECQEVLGNEGKVVGVLTKGGETIDCDMVVFTIGVVPQTNWLKESGLERDKTGGVVVNEYLETSLPGVWAAGDCTSVVWFNGVRRPEQLWYTARDQGEIAGLNLVGGKNIYRRGTLYNSAKFFDLEYTTAGYVNFKFEGEQSWYQCEPTTNYSERITYLPDRSVIGFNMIGRRWDHRVMIRWVEEKRPLEWVSGCCRLCSRVWEQVCRPVC
jgi:NADPH-dependent 2,4-dienoyl-CoA reductase/sulfur reductase-like enzyme